MVDKIVCVEKKYPDSAMSAVTWRKDARHTKIQLIPALSSMTNRIGKKNCRCRHIRK